jgi:FHIPEP family/ATPase family associated with various cellular activities (AAA)
MGGGPAEERVFRVRVPGESTGAQGPWRFGSGYTVASGRVLTASHVLIPPDRVANPRVGEPCEVLRWPCDDDNWQPSVVLWVDNERDLALISASTSVDVPDVRFGRLDGNDVELWQAIGFPLASLGTSGRHADPASGTTRGLGLGTLQLTVTSRNPRPRSDDESGWAGLSGAAVFCGDCLVGVVSKDLEAWEKSLEATEIAPVVSIAGFAGALPHPPSLEQVRSDWYATGTKIFISGGQVTIAGEPQGPQVARRNTGDADATTGQPATSSPVGLDAVVDELLQRAGLQRTPIVVAVETTSQALTDEDLLRTRRHLTVSLPPESVERCAALAMSVTAAMALDDVVLIGAQIWKELVRAQPRLAGLLQGMGDAAAAQPLAWAGHRDLLDELRRALLLAHTGTGGTDGFVSVGYGGHYLQPADAATNQRSMNPKGRGAPEVAVLDASYASTADDKWKAAVLSAGAAEIVIASGTAERPAGVPAIAEDLARVAGRRTRALLALGSAPLDASAAHRLLSGIPFVSVAQDANGAELRDVLRSALERHASAYAMPCIVGAVRAAWLRRAAKLGDTRAVVAALEWTSWSWVGLTLFASSYVQPERATYPHLDDLRSVAGSGWYYARHKGIPEEYTGEALSGIDIEPARQFHLYLSGAGGTGKSCFLRFVHDELVQRGNRLAVWYRVDAPGSSWDMLQKRIREEALHAARDSFPEVAEELEAINSRRLSVFLRESAKLLRERLDPDFEIAVFIDQLERTFESSDEPEPDRLETISDQLLQMLEDVNVGQGVRVFIASRKQYLPDFLRSSRAITDYGLQFNVLQPVTDETERKEFVRRVVDWCRDEQLVGPDVELRPEAAEMLVRKARGNPLNMMLTLIQLLSADVDGPITVAELERHSPWEHLFALDLAAARQDDIDWYFLLAMAHTRTEIVRFEDVWWRLRLVDPRLTQQVDARRTDGALEQLWFHGFLGRTLHPRAAGDNPARYLEFFHANLRDHLLSAVMASATARDPLGARSGAPAAWRALDRLAAFAHDWEQTQQLLPAEDVRALMEHRDVVVESHQSLGSHVGPFDLLFLRNQEDARPGLMRAATECFVLSALVRDDLGAWAFQRLFPQVEGRVALCLSWLRSGSRRTRGSVLRYVVEQEYAWEGLTRFVLDDAEPLAEETAAMLAVILAEPLYAARYRNDVLSVVIETAAKASGSPEALPIRVVRLLVAACSFESETLARLVSHVRMRAGLADEQAKSPAARLSEAVVDTWLQQAAESGLELVGWSEQPATLDQAALGLVVGENLASIVDRRALERWSAELRSRLGVPVPALQLVRGECLPDELELRFATERVQAHVFYTDRVCVLRRHWESTGRALPTDAVRAYDSAGEEDVLWLGRDAMKSLDSTLPIRELEATAIDWLEAHCRREFDRLFDDELLIQFVQEATAARRWDRLTGYGRDQLRSIIVGLVEEGIPLDGPGWDLNRLLRRIGAHDPETVIRLVRDAAKRQISESLGDSAGLVNAIVLDEKLEQSLADSTRPGVRGGRVLQPGRAFALTDVAAAVRRQVESALRQDGLHMPVLVTQSPLRAPLSQLLRRFDVRLKVLSFTELDPEVVTPALVGVVRTGSDEGPPS